MGGRASVQDREQEGSHDHGDDESRRWPGQPVLVPVLPTRFDGTGSRCSCNGGRELHRGLRMSSRRGTTQESFDGSRCASIGQMTRDPAQRGSD